MSRLPLVAALLAAALSPAQARENVMLVLDASGSMWGKVGEQTKVEIAREAVGQLVRGWEPANQLGLVTYGHRRKGDCADIETLIPLGPLDATAYLGTVNRLNALGMTPLSAAVVQAAEALKLSEQKATVILVSDGEETCNLDPCQIGRELEQRGVDFTAHVIGFDVAKAEHQAQLRCLAENTGGRFFSAQDAAGLTRALDAAVSVSTEPALPPATATLSAPAEAMVAGSLTVGFTGPKDPEDYIALVNAEGAERAHAWVKDAGSEGTVTLLLPGDPGAYRLRYVSPRRPSPTLAERPIQLTPAQAAIEAPAQVSAGGQIVLKTRGPTGERHWVGVAEKGAPLSQHLAFEWIGAAHPAERKLQAPSTPGDYELRYVLDNAEGVLLARPLTVVDGGQALRGPAEVMAGNPITVQLANPIDGGHWVGIAPVGSEPGQYLHHSSYAYVSAGQSEYTLAAPVQPGAYELRYVLVGPERVSASQPLTVAPAQATLTAPASVAAGGSLRVTATGPVGERHWVGIAPAGSAADAYLDYCYTTDMANGCELTAPDAAGSYELRYVLQAEDTLVVARQPLGVQ